MSTHNIQLHDKIRKFSLIFVFWSYPKNFAGTQKPVGITHGTCASSIRAIEVPMYIVDKRTLILS